MSTTDVSLLQNPIIYYWTCKGPGLMLLKIKSCFLYATKELDCSYLYGCITKNTIIFYVTIVFMYGVYFLTVLKIWFWSSWTKHPNLQKGLFLNNFLKLDLASKHLDLINYNNFFSLLVNSLHDYFRLDIYSTDLAVLKTAWSMQHLNEGCLEITLKACPRG